VLELRRLRYFLAVAAARNFTRAAEQLHIAQPALSRQLRLLEQELGVELILRTTHSFELTPAGEYLLAHAPEALAAIDALERTTKSFGSGQVGSVTVAYGTSAGYDTAPRLLRAIAERLPELQLTTDVMSVDEILDRIRDGVVDVGIVRCPPRADDLESRLLRLESQGVLLRDDHPLAARATVDVADLADERVLLHAREANPGHYDAVVRLFTDNALEPQLELRPTAFDLAHTPVADGGAIAVVGDSARVGLPAGLTWLELSPPTVFDVRLLARSLNRPPAVERLLDVAETVADELAWRQGSGTS
jgi:DNA-binding transcriptional LysR family regulator